MKIVIVDQRIDPICQRALEKEGFYLLKLPADPCLGEAVKSHPDTVLFYDDGELITTADYCEYGAYIFSDIREYRPDVKVSFTSDVRHSKYPYDCLMNALVIENKLFCKTDSVSPKIIDHARQRSYEIRHVNQGYPACTVLRFGENAITADQGMAKALTESGINVTLICAGGISLLGHEYGFIGGASGVYNDKIYFYGNLNSHPDAEIIKNAITNAGYTPISLSDQPLTDLGGMIFL